MGLYLLIPISVVLVFIIGVIFWWSVRSGQYDDMEGPAYRLLMDDKDAEKPQVTKSSEPSHHDAEAESPPEGEAHERRDRERLLAAPAREIGQDEACSSDVQKPDQRD